MPGMNRSKKMMMMMTFVQIQNEWIKLRRNLFILFHRSNWIANSLKWNEIQENRFWFGFFYSTTKKKEFTSFSNDNHHHHYGWKLKNGQITSSRSKKKTSTLFIRAIYLIHSFIQWMIQMMMEMEPFYTTEHHIFIRTFCYFLCVL